MFRVGDVLKTTENYTSTGFEPKRRWFIYLGKAKWGTSPRNIFLCTTTTQISQYKADSKYTIVDLANETSIFESDCIACLDMLETSYEEEEFIKLYKPENKGHLSEEKLKEIYRKIEQANISKIIKRDIKESFQLDEIKTK